ncbi:MAG: quinoprotein dehydrogenase-associated SoxYZ-like carrier [Microvirga sp.]
MVRCSRFGPFMGMFMGMTLMAAVWGGSAWADESEAAWDSIRPDVAGQRAIEDGAAMIDLVAPKRAEDAALVPVDVRIHMPDGDARTVRAIKLVIDENPAPLAATFQFGEDGRRSFELSTRVRVNSYSYVRVIGEMSDGALYMVKSYVKAAGGCSAPATKDPAEAKANLGEMRFRAFADTGRNEAQVQIRYPNYSGLQMDQITRFYTPAWFVQDLAVKQGERLIFRMEGGISISEDPTFRFSYRPNGEPVSVEARDTEGKTFRRSFPGGQGS